MANAGRKLRIKLHAYKTFCICLLFWGNAPHSYSSVQWQKQVSVEVFAQESNETIEVLTNPFNTDGVTTIVSFEPMEINLVHPLQLQVRSSRHTVLYLAEDVPQFL